MKDATNRFIQELKAYESAEQVFNPWRDYDESFDIGPEAPLIRANQMEQFLIPRIPTAKYLLVAEAISYQGGKFTGVALSSERILLGNHKTIRPAFLLQKTPGRRTSNPSNPSLKTIQRQLGFTEPTATIVWGAIKENQITPNKIITWNIFPFHPFNADKGPLSNRTPTGSELEVGRHFTEMLLKIIPQVSIISVGVHSTRTLSRLGIESLHVPHPANGGATRFRAAMNKIFATEENNSQ
ncbi:MAG: uracil-DNA glycosylase [Bacillota bacterium]